MNADNFATKTARHEESTNCFFLEEGEKIFLPRIHTNLHESSSRQAAKVSSWPFAAFVVENIFFVFRRGWGIISAARE
jgi:hypothetical protein